MLFATADKKPGICFLNTKTVKLCRGFLSFHVSCEAKIGDSARCMKARPYLTLSFMTIYSN